MANYPVIKDSDMSAEVREEALDICLLACEKHAADLEKCTQARFTPVAPRCAMCRLLCCALLAA